MVSCRDGPMGGLAGAMVPPQFIKKIIIILKPKKKKKKNYTGPLPKTCLADRSPSKMKNNNNNNNNN